MTIQELAREYANLFCCGKRLNGDNYLFIEEKNTKLLDLIHQFHKGLMPDDYIYQFTYEALEAIAEHDNIDNICLEADIYNNDLLKWVSSNLIRADYVDQAVEDYVYKDFYTALSMGQSKEKEEILILVRNKLESILEDINNEEI